MKTAIAVIGAGYGDEGKGKMVDYFASRADHPMVIRFNGGAQAGHTVQTSDGRRHVFSHIGSGYFHRAPTILSEFFVSNPVVFTTERNELVSKFGIEPVVYVDCLSRITTPFDVVINRAAEEARSNRHGSCGLGVNETIKRSDYRGCDLRAEDLVTMTTKRLVDHLKFIRQEWVPKRAATLGIDLSDRAEAMSDDVIAWFVKACEYFRKHIYVIGGNFIADLDDKFQLIFEGAQGLMLDAGHMFFPYVTPSNTGLRNVISLIRGVNVPTIEAVYVTRAYGTRHGPGPFPGEAVNLRLDDPTNSPNDWQGNLRLGRLDLNQINSAITGDLRRAEEFTRGWIRIEPKISLTCLDQMSPLIPVDYSGEIIPCTHRQLWQKLCVIGETASGFVSHGPTRESVRPVTISDDV